MRETIRIKSAKHPAGYYTQWKDLMQPGDVEYRDAEEFPPKIIKTRFPTKKVKNDKSK
ncbi:MAG: hypothetical protein QMD11_07930 [Smithella sp.]|nr:hypothetical protein [Smithella sp.]